MQAASRVRELFNQALELPPAARRELLERESRLDSAAALECERLLNAFERSGEFLESGASGLLELPSAPTRIFDRASRSTTSGPQEPPRIPEYELIRRIGQGGSGDVWLARSVMGRQYCAVKVVRGGEVELEGVRQYKARIQEHPNLYPIEHIGMLAGDAFYYVMPLADNATGGAGLTDPAVYEPSNLKAHLARHGRLSTDEVVEVGVSIAEALAHLHECGAVHGDVKPANIMRYAGEWRLGDHGLMADLRQGHVKGYTEGYCAPEGVGTRASDQFALGRTLFVIWTGLDAAKFKDFRDGLIETPAGRGASRLRDIIVRACASSPSERFGSVAELRAALIALRARPVISGPRIAAVVGSIILVAAIAIAAARLAGPSAAPPDGPLAQIEAQHFRGDPGVLLGAVGITSNDIRVDDDVRLTAELQSPSYCYLIAFNTDGSHQLCWPESDSQAPPRIEALSFPMNVTDAFGLTDGPGVQAFALVSSSKPLPAFQDWPAAADTGWSRCAIEGAGAWSFDGDAFVPLGATRGQVRDRSLAPVPLVTMVDRLKSAEGVDHVAVVAFPVRDHAE